MKKYIILMVSSLYASEHAIQPYRSNLDPERSKEIAQFFNGILPSDITTTIILPYLQEWKKGKIIKDIIMPRSLDSRLYWSTLYDPADIESEKEKLLMRFAAGKLHADKTLVKLSSPPLKTNNIVRMQIDSYKKVPTQYSTIPKRVGETKVTYRRLSQSMIIEYDTVTDESKLVTHTKTIWHYHDLCEEAYHYGMKLLQKPTQSALPSA